MHRLRRAVAAVFGVGATGTAIRATVAITAPVVVGQVVDERALGLFAMLGALNVAIADTGGPFGQRIAGMAVALVGICAAIAAGAALSGNRWPGVAALGVVAFLGGLVRQLGEAGARVGMVVSIAFLLGVGLPGEAPGVRALAALVGGVLTIVLVAGFWPFGADHPALRALVTAFRELAAFARAGAERGWSPTEAAASRDAIDSLRAELESLGAFHGRTGTRVDLLIASSRSASRLFAATAAVIRARERAAIAGVSFPDAEVSAALDAIGAAADRLGDAVERHETRVELPGFDEAIARGRAACEGSDSEPVVVAGRALALAARHARALVVTFHEAVGERAARVPFRPRRSLAEAARDVLVALRRQLGPGSESVHYALKLGVATAASMAVAMQIDVGRIYWGPLTVMIVLQPGARETVSKALDRTVGTVIGAIVGALLLAAISSDPALDVVIFVTALVTLLLFTRAYRGAVIALTVLVLALLETLVPSTWEIAAYRIVDTIVGAAIGVAVSLLVWRTPRRLPIVDRLAEVVRAVAAYERGVAASYVGRQPARPVTVLGRRAGRSIQDAAAARESLPPGPLARAAGDAIAGARSAVDALAALDLVRSGPREAIGREVDAFGVQIESATADALQAIEAGRPPDEPPDFEVGLAGVRALPRPGDADAGLVVAELEHLAAGITSLLGGIEGVTRTLSGAEARAR
jgi:uncharacterized membrane protein YccC